jgi:hypothetical protein
MTAVLWINVLLAIPFIALWAGIPMWLVLRRQDRKPRLAAAPAVRMVPAVRHQDARYRRRLARRVPGPRSFM